MLVFVLHIIAHCKVTTAPRAYTRSLNTAAMVARKKAIHGSKSPSHSVRCLLQKSLLNAHPARTESDAELSGWLYLLRRPASHLLVD